MVGNYCVYPVKYYDDFILDRKKFDMHMYSQILILFRNIIVNMYTLAPATFLTVVTVTKNCHNKLLT